MFHRQADSCQIYRCRSTREIQSFREKSIQPKNWIDFGKDYGEEYGRFDGDVLVNDENSEASSDEIEKWKKDEKRLWNCHILVRLEIRSVRPFGPDDEVKL